MVTSNPERDGKWLSDMDALRKKYKDFKFTHELEDIQQPERIGECEQLKIAAYTSPSVATVVSSRTHQADQ